MQTTRHRLTSSNSVIPLTVSFYTASCAVATPALALPRAVNDVAISVVTDPATSFVTGCATGAIIAGLLVSLMSRGSRKRLQEQLAESMDALTRAEGAAHAAEQMLREMQLEMGVLNGRPYSPFDYVGSVKLEDTEPFAARDDDSRQQGGSLAGTMSEWDADGNVGEDTVAYDTAKENGFDVAGDQSLERQPQEPSVKQEATAMTAEVEQGGARRQDVTDAGPAHTGSHLRTSAKAAKTQAAAGTAKKARPGATGQSVAGRLVERYGRGRGSEIVIERAPQAVADTRPHAHTVRPAPTMRYFDPKRRAEAINRRVPRIDESLYPDMTAAATRDLDPFATAMRAMDRAMVPGQAAWPAPGAAGHQAGVPYQGVAGHRDRSDHQGSQDLGATRGELIARSTPTISAEDKEHVDRLVREELEINRSGAPRRFSRSQLTMIDGGEQAGAPRKGGRHFANVS